MAASRAALVWFLALYGALYAAFGVQSPYLPPLLAARGLGLEEIGMVLAAGTAIRLVSGPAAGRVADLLGAPKMVLAACAASAALIALGYAPARGFWPLLTVGVLHAASLAPLAALADTLALGAAAPPLPGRSPGPGFGYGWVRGAGSAAFILGLVLSGQAVARLGIGVIVWLNAALLAIAALVAARVPRLLPPRAAFRDSAATAGALTGRLGGLRTLLRRPTFTRVMLVAALILGSHAMHDSFAVIRWERAGLGADTAGLLWSEQVAAEIVVFLLLGRPLLDRLGPARAAALAALAGVVRWAVMAQTAWVPAMMLVEPLHGLTFALLHLACLRLIAATIPPSLAATAVALYGTAAIGAATAILTLASGPLYARFGAEGFWVMAALCAAALPVALTLPGPTAQLSG